MADCAHQRGSVPATRRTSSLGSSTGAAFIVCILVCCQLLLGCNADNNADLLNGINDYRVQTLNISSLTVNVGAQCLATHLADVYKTTVCTNTTAQYSVDDNFNGYDQSIEDCHIPPQNVQAAAILPVCVNDSRVTSALVFYTTKAQVEYQAEINSSMYVTAGVGSAGNYYFVILGTTAENGNLAQTANGGERSSSVSILSIFMPFLVALLCQSF